MSTGSEAMTDLKMYDSLAQWWPLLSPVAEYAEEAAFFLETLLAHPSLPEQPTLLELGSGGGSNAYYLKAHFTCTLVDLAPGMLEVSRTLNPECAHEVGDMRTVRVGHTFDAVFIHDALDYMTSEAEVRQALETAFLHCKPGGVALFVPDHLRETFEPDSDHGGADGADRSLRYLEWTLDPDPTDSTCVTHYAYMLHKGDRLWVEHETHTHGLFARAEWLRWLADAGFEAEIVTDPFERECFLARRP
jgi:trans-aconitate methyltransferase